MNPENVRTPFIAFLRESAQGGAQYLTFNGGQYQVITFRDDEAAVAYRDGMSTTGKEWSFATVHVDAPVASCPSNFDRIADALELATAVVELNTPNGVTKQPALGEGFGFDTGRVDHVGIAKHCRLTLAVAAGRDA